MALRRLVLNIACSSEELNLAITLRCGQSFRWREGSPGVWTGCIREQVWSLSQSPSVVRCVLHNCANEEMPHKKIKLEPTEYDASWTAEITKPLAVAALVKQEVKNEDIFVQNSMYDSVKSRSARRNATKNALETADENDQPTDKQIDSRNKNAPSKRKTKAEQTISLSKVKIKKEAGIDDITTSVINPNISIDHEASEVTNISDSLLEYYAGTLHSYFRLEVNLVELYQHWSQCDAHFAKIAPAFPGIRMLEQPPVENLFSFICSSNNNIVRISQLVEKLSVNFGSKLCTVDGFDWYSFPAVESLTRPEVEEVLRTLAFGYRAAYIARSAQSVSDHGGERWLVSLRTLSYDQCRAQLCTLQGVGPKVADCVCLMSLGHLATTPVDTHVFQIAARDYLPELSGAKTVTVSVYRRINRFFEELYGPMAGWAHSVLFSADLKRFSSTKAKKRTLQAKKVKC